MLTFLPEMLASWIPRAASIGFMIAQPYLVKATLAYIMSHDTLPVSYGYGLIAAYGLTYIGIAVRFPGLCLRALTNRSSSQICYSHF
jgi:hypothetical protein